MLRYKSTAVDVSIFLLPLCSPPPPPWQAHAEQSTPAATAQHPGSHCSHGHGVSFTNRDAHGSHCSQELRKLESTTIVLDNMLEV